MALGILLFRCQVILTKNRVAFDLSEFSRFDHSLPHATLVTHPDFLQDSTGSFVAGEVRGKDALEIQLLKAEADNSPSGFRCITITPKRHSDPVSKLRLLRLTIW